MEGVLWFHHRKLCIPLTTNVVSSILLILEDLVVAKSCNVYSFFLVSNIAIVNISSILRTHSGKMK